eukprot:6214025-Pleurochrysis_carterae.AAC.4
MQERRSTCSTPTTGSRGSSVVLGRDVSLRVTLASSRVGSSFHPEARQHGTGSLLSARSYRRAPPSAPATAAMGVASSRTSSTASWCILGKCPILIAKTKTICILPASAVVNIVANSFQLSVDGDWWANTVTFKQQQIS